MVEAKSIVELLLRVKAPIVSDVLTVSAVCPALIRPPLLGAPVPADRATGAVSLTRLVRLVFDKSSVPLAFTVTLDVLPSAPVPPAFNIPLLIVVVPE